MRAAVALLALLATAAGAAEVSSGTRTARLSWTAPTTDIYDRPLTVPLRYRVYRRPQTAGAPRTLVQETSDTTLTLVKQPLGTQCYAVTAVAGSDESQPSAEGCKLMTSDLSPPRQGTIERPTRGSIDRR